MGIGQNNTLNSSRAIRSTSSNHLKPSSAKIAESLSSAIKTGNAHEFMKFAKGAAASLDTSPKIDVIQQRRDASRIHNTALDMTEGGSNASIASNFDKLSESRALSAEAKEVFKTASTLIKADGSENFDSQALNRLLQNPEINKSLANEVKSVLEKDLAPKLDEINPAEKENTTQSKFESYAFNSPGQIQAQKAQETKELLKPVDDAWRNSGAV